MADKIKLLTVSADKNMEMTLEFNSALDDPENMSLAVLAVHSAMIGLARAAGVEPNEFLAEMLKVSGFEVTDVDDEEE